IVLGRRGVGKSTLIRRAVELLSDSPALIVVLDMQGYAGLRKSDLYREVMHDVLSGLVNAAHSVSHRFDITLDASGLEKLATRLVNAELGVEEAVHLVKRQI